MEWVTPGRVILVGLAWYWIRYFLRVWPRDGGDQL